MPRETDLLRVKLVAHTLLDVQIQETALSPVIVSHPFTNSGISALRNEDGSLSMVDLINNSDDCTRWRRKVGEQIDSAENVHQLFVLLNPPYYLTFIKFAASALSEKDLGQLLSIQDLLQALQWEPDRVSAFWPDLCDACRTLYRLSGEQLDIYVRLTQPAYAADLHLVEPDTLPPS